MSQHVEVEAKFSVSESTVVPDLTEIHGVVSINSSEVHHLSAVYFDTHDLRLTRAKITLRRRTGGTDAGWHIKFPGSFARMEIHGGLDDPGADEQTPPPAVLGHVRALLRGHALQPIAQVDNERHVSYLSNAQGDVIGEFCDDHVSTVSRLPGGARRQWREWEFELAEQLNEQEAGWALIQSATRRLTAAGAFVSDSPSKLVTALGDSIKYAPTPPEKLQLPKDDPAHAVLSAIEANANKIVEFDPKVRADEWDSVHQMRVATRELRSHMQTFEGILGGDTYLQIEKELKQLATILGKARDAEVIEERLANLIDTEAGQVVAEEVKEELLADLGDVYAREHARVVAALDSDRYSRLLQSLEGLLANPPLMITADTTKLVADSHRDQPTQTKQPEQPESPGVEQLDRSAEAGDLNTEIPGENLLESPTDLEKVAPGSPEDTADSTAPLDQEDVLQPGSTAAQTGDKVDAVEVLLQHLDKAHSKVVKRHKKAIREWEDHEIPLSEREENFHQVRKAIKKLRYSAEAVGDATPVNTRKLYKACSRLQSVLGDFQDAVTSRDELLHRVQQSQLKAENSFALGVLYQKEQGLSREYLAGYGDAYQAVSKAYGKLEEDTAKAAKKRNKKTSGKKKK